MTRAALLVFLFLTSFLGPIAQTTSNTQTGDHRAQSRTHRGGKDDIDAIGSRQFGKRGLGNWFSPEKELAVGKDYAEEIETDVTILHDKAVTDYVEALVHNIAMHSDAQLPFTVRVIESDEINAFSLIGGYLYVNTGMIIACDEEAQLAGVIAHEIAHVAAHHAARQITRSNLFDLASIPLAMVGGGAVLGAVRVVADIGGPLASMSFSRSFESEADYLGIEYLYAAGYDPDAYISFLERFEQSDAKSGRFKSLFANHPKTSDRVKKLQKEIAQVLRSRSDYVVTTSEFDEVKRMLLLAEMRKHNSGAPLAPSLRKNTQHTSDDD